MNTHVPLFLSILSERNNEEGGCYCLVLHADRSVPALSREPRASLVGTRNFSLTTSVAPEGLGALPLMGFLWPP